MSSVFGNVRQLGFMSRDLDRSIQYFVETWGVGPWFVLRNMQSSMLYKGAAVELDMSVAMANCGELQFEIVAQHNEAQSLYTDALAAIPGLHIQHVAVWTDDPLGTQAAAHAKGWTTVFETVSGPGKSIFVSHPSEPAVHIEISDCDPFKDGVRDAIRRLATDWDGRDPVREGITDLAAPA